MKLLSIFYLVIAVISAAESKGNRTPPAQFTNNASPTAKHVAKQLLTLLTKTIGAFEEDFMAPYRLRQSGGNEHSMGQEDYTSYFSFRHPRQALDEHESSTVLEVRSFLGNEQFLFTVAIKHLLLEDRHRGNQYFKTESIEITADPFQVPVDQSYIDLGIENPDKTMIFGFSCESRPVSSAILDTLHLQGVFICDDGPTILESMGSKIYSISPNTKMSLFRVEKDTTRDGHRTCFTNTEVKVEYYDEIHRFRLDVTFQHQENPDEKSFIPKELRYRPILIALKRREQ